MDYPINIFYREEDEGNVTDIPDLDPCSPFGDTSEEALREIEAEAWTKAAKAEGKSKSSEQRSRPKSFRNAVPP